MPEQAPAAEAKADVNQSTVSSEASEAEAMQAALDAVGGDEPAQETPPPKDGAEKADGDKPDAEKAPEGPAAKGWAAVRKREQRIAKEAKAFKEQQQSFQAQLTEFQARAKAIEERETELEGDPVGFLAKRGLNFDDLARRYLQDGKPSDQELARRGAEKQDGEVKTLKTELRQVKEMLRKQDEDKLVGQYRDTIRTTLASDEFDLLRTYPNAENEIFEFADKYARQTGQVLSAADAAARLQTEWQKQLSSLASHDAVRKLLGVAGNGGPSKQAVGGPSQVPQRSGASPRTLTNNLAATPAASEPEWDSLSEEDQIQAALRLVQDA